MSKKASITIDIFSDRRIEDNVPVSKMFLPPEYGRGTRKAFSASAIDGTCAFWIRYRHVCSEARLVSLLRETDVRSLLNEGRKLATAFHETNQIGFGRAMRDLYNKGMRVNALPPWTERVMSERARAGASDRARRAIATRKKNGEDFSAIGRNAVAVRETRRRKAAAEQTSRSEAGERP